MVDWSRLKFVICDRDPHYRKLVHQMLREKTPKAIVEGRGGRYDKDIIARVKPDVVIGSLTEGDDFSLDLVRWLRDAAVTPCPGIPVILMAVVTSDDALRQGIRAGVDYFLAKPLSPQVLQTRIETLLAKPLKLTNTRKYVGPDRRRMPREAYDGPERRGESEESDAA